MVCRNTGGGLDRREESAKTKVFLTRQLLSLRKAMRKTFKCFHSKNNLCNNKNVKMRKYFSVDWYLIILAKELL